MTYFGDDALICLQDFLDPLQPVEAENHCNHVDEAAVSLNHVVEGRGSLSLGAALLVVMSLSLSHDGEGVMATGIGS